jgi:hypothetical protein
MTKQDYYEYVVGDGPTWWKKDPPPRNKIFEQGLRDLAGVNTFGNPILRVEWGGTLLSDVAAVDTLKYKQIWEGITHFYYLDKGTQRIIKHPSEAPEGAVAIPVYGTIELGRPRWIIEKWQSAEDVDRSGRFDLDTRDEKGNKIFRSIPREGIYNCWLIVQNRAFGYRDLDTPLLEAVSEMWRYQERTSIEQQYRDMLADEKKKEIDARLASKEMWQAATA